MTTDEAELTAANLLKWNRDIHWRGRIVAYEVSKFLVRDPFIWIWQAQVRAQIHERPGGSLLYDWKFWSFAEAIRNIRSISFPTFPQYIEGVTIGFFPGLRLIRKPPIDSTRRMYVRRIDPLRNSNDYYRTSSGESYLVAGSVDGAF